MPSPAATWKKPVPATTSASRTPTSSSPLAKVPGSDSPAGAAMTQEARGREAECVGRDSAETGQNENSSFDAGIAEGVPCDDDNPVHRPAVGHRLRRKRTRPVGGDLHYALYLVFAPLKVDGAACGERLDKCKALLLLPTTVVWRDFVCRGPRNVSGSTPSGSCAWKLDGAADRPVGSHRSPKWSGSRRFWSAR